MRKIIVLKLIIRKGKTMIQEKMETGIPVESQIEQKEKEKPCETRIIFQRHSEYKKEPKDECYWRIGIDGKNKQGLIDFLAEKKIISEEEKNKMGQAKFIEDELVKIADDGKLLDSPEEKDFLDFLVGIEFAKNPEEAKETFQDYIDNNRNFNETKKESGAGLLTDKGKELTREATMERLKEIVAEDKPTDIVFPYSPTEWLDWRDEQGFAKGFGSRGKETTKEILNTISSEIKNNTEIGKKLKENVRITGIGPNEKLRELDIFYIFDAPNPRAYIKALHEKFGKEDWWEPYYNIVQELEDLRKETKAEGPEDLARRFESIIKMAKLYSDKIREKDTERNLVIWMVSHMELIRSFLQHQLKAGKDVENYVPDYNESLDIDISPDGKMTTEFRGKEYEVEA